MAGRTTGLLVGAGRERQVPLRGRITRQNAAACIARLVVLATEGPGQPIAIYIDSPGGPITESLPIISTINGIRCPVATFCHAPALGTAAIIAAHGTRGFRTAVPGAVLSFKLAETRGQQQFHHLLAEIVAKDTRKTLATVLNWLREGHEFDAQQALASGLIDTISAQPVLPPI